MVDKNRMLTPQQFLRELGIIKTPELDQDAIQREMVAAGIDLVAAKDCRGFGPAAGDAFFATERLARSILSNNFERLKDNLHGFTSIRGFPEHPKRIGDLGGGAGVLAMFLAQRQA